MTMRVLHAYKIYKPDVEGGIPHVIASLTEPIDPQIDNSIIVARRRGGSREFFQNGVLVRASASLGTVFSTPISPNYVARFLQLASRADLIVHHAPFPLTDLALTLSTTRARLIVHWHAEILNRSILKALVAPAIRRSLKRADRIIVSHPAIIEQSEFLRPFAQKCTAIPYGIDFSYWSSLDFQQREQVAEMKRNFPRLVVAIGRLVSYKGFSVLLQALRGVDAKLLIIGEGPDLEMLRHEATKQGLAHQVTFSGRMDRDLIKLHLHAADVFALPSNSTAEAFGIVQLEAMACGCAVINTSLATAVPFVARHELEGLTVPVGDVGPFRAALERLFDKPELAKLLGENGKRRVEALFQNGLFRKRNFELYRKVVSP